MTFVPRKKNDGLHAHSWQNNVETAAAPTNSTGVESMSNTIQPIVPAGFTPHYPEVVHADGTWTTETTAPPAWWDGPGVQMPGADLISFWVPGRIKLLDAHGNELTVSDLDGVIQAVTALRDQLRAAEQEAQR